MARTRKAYKKSDEKSGSQTRYIPDDTTASFIVNEKPEQNMTLAQIGFFPDRNYRSVEQAPQKNQEESTGVWAKACSPKNVS